MIEHRNEQGQPHREDGPAIEYANGHREWWVNGQPHREDGPAIEYANGHREWWVDDKRMTEEQFNAWRAEAAPTTGEEK